MNDSVKFGAAGMCLLGALVIVPISKFGSFILIIAVAAAAIGAASKR